MFALKESRADQRLYLVQPKTEVKHKKNEINSFI